MKTILVFIALLLSGCAMIQEIQDNKEKRRAYREQRANEREEQEDAEEKERELAEKKLEEKKKWNEAREIAKLMLASKVIDRGESIDVVHKYWGNPQKTDEDKNGYYEWYDDDIEPVIFQFNKKTKKLIIWAVDVDAKKEKEHRRREAALQARIDALEARDEQRQNDLNQLRYEQAQQERSQAWQNFGNVLNNINTQNQIDSLKSSQQPQRSNYIPMRH